MNEGHKQLAQKLLELHRTKNPYIELPNYNYEQLQNGIYCKDCRSFLISLENKHFVCKKCGEREQIGLGILRNAEEFKLLFPDKKITTQNIYEWCNKITSKNSIGKILAKNFKIVGIHQWAYYESDLKK